MAFKIIPKIKADDIKTKVLDAKILPKYYKGLQQSLIKKTSPELTTDYFFCQDFNGEPLLVMGTATPAYKKVFREAGKGKDGFDKSLISGGKSFILKEDNKAILCLQPDPSLGKGKKIPTIKALTKLKRAFMKQITEIRWLDAPLETTSTEENPETSTEQTEQTGPQTDTSTPETSTDTASNTGTTSSDTETEESTRSGQPQPRTTGTEQSTDTNSSGTTGGSTPIVGRDDIVKRAKDLQRGIRKIKDDVMPRYKKQETTPRDGDFVNAMYKAGMLFKSKLTQTDKTTKSEFKSNVEFLDKALPQWKELEERLRGSKDRSEMRAALKEKLETTVESMNEIRQQIKDILKRTNLKEMA